MLFASLILVTVEDIKYDLDRNEIFERKNYHYHSINDNISTNLLDTEMSVELGMLELVPEDLALCSYVCPSKYDYSSILIDNLNKLYSEL